LELGGVKKFSFNRLLFSKILSEATLLTFFFSSTREAAGGTIAGAILGEAKTLPNMVAIFLLSRR